MRRSSSAPRKRKEGLATKMDRLPAVTGMRAFANTLLYDSAGGTAALEGEGPELGALLRQEPHADGPEVSRMGPKT